MNRSLTLGSLFDGSGGFPLGGLIAGATPVWASEIEPFPIRVTTKRLPFMKHYGDITSMDGSKIEPVDIITFGSPCTDMSVAGKRAGLDGKQSILFYEAIRIIKEMRCATNGQYPRWICWENVPGAFSSNSGHDFQAVLEAVIGIVHPNTQVPMPDKNRWPNADVYMGPGFSVAYRTLDCQYWGLPQRRKRIFLVGDLTGQCAGKVLFESEGVSGYSAESFRAWQRTTGGAACRSGTAGISIDGYNGTVSPVASTLGVNCGMSTGRNGVVLNDQGGNRMDVTHDLTCTLRAEAHHPPVVLDELPRIFGICSKDSNAMKSDNPHSGFYEAATTRTTDGNGGNPTCNQGGVAIVENKTFCASKASFFMKADEEIAATLCATDYKDPPLINGSAKYTVRRLTPTECARLQGFPDWWCADLGIAEPTMDDIRYWYDVFETHRKIVGSSSKAKSIRQITKWLQDPHSDAAEYKMWGNGVALPCVAFVLSGIVFYTQSDGV